MPVTQGIMHPRQANRKTNRTADSFLPPHPKDNAYMVMVVISDATVITLNTIFSYSDKLIVSNANT